MGRRFGIWLLTASSLSLALPAGAAPKEAQALMREAKALMARRQYAAACPKIAESQRLAPSPKSLLELAICHEKEGKTATAYAEFRTVVQQAEWEGPKQAAKTAKEHIAELETKVSHITIKVPTSSETDGLEVTMDGLPVTRGAWGLPQAVDPGRHEVSASGPGRERWSTTIRIMGDSEQQSVQVPPPLSAARAAVAPETVAQKEARAEDPDYEMKHAASEDKETPKASKPIAGYLLVGAGLVSIGIGSFFGVRAIQYRHDSNDACANGCSQEGVDLNNQAKSAAWISNIGLGVGLVGVGIGSYVVLTSGPSDTDKPKETADRSIRVVPDVGSTYASVTVRGSW
jgi:hypothetical protein